MNKKINRREIIDKFHQMIKDDDEKEKEKYNEILKQLRLTEKEQDKEIIEQIKIKNKEKIVQESSKESSKELSKEKIKIKIDIANRQQKFLSDINFNDVKTITKHGEFSCLVMCFDSEHDIYNKQITYTIEYNNGLLTEKREIVKKVFEILYTKLHFIEFIDDIEIIHFVKI
jgi:hypothetical protein